MFLHCASVVVLSNLAHLWPLWPQCFPSFNTCLDLAWYKIHNQNYFKVGLSCFWQLSCSLTCRATFWGMDHLFGSVCRIVPCQPHSLKKNKKQLHPKELAFVIRGKGCNRSVQVFPLIVMETWHRGGHFPHNAATHVTHSMRPFTPLQLLRLQPGILTTCIQAALEHCSVCIEFGYDKLHICTWLYLFRTLSACAYIGQHHRGHKTHCGR